MTSVNWGKYAGTKCVHILCRHVTSQVVEVELLKGKNLNDEGAVQ